VITHGTDTMAETAAVLGQAFSSGDAALAGKRIVLTGAMVPYSVSGSDALFNLGGAVMAFPTACGWRLYRHERTLLSVG